MRNETKMLFAVLAVGIMLGCGLVPLTVGNSNGQTESAAADGDDGYSLLDFIETVRELGNNVGDVKLDSGLSLVEVDEGSFSSVETDGDIAGKFSVDDGEKLTLTGEYIFKPKTTGQGTEEGRIEVMDGGMIVMLPLENNDGFSMKNCNSDCKKIVVLHAGAYLSILGVTFKVVYCDDGTLDGSLGLISLDKTYHGVQPSFNVAYKYGGSEDSQLNVKVDSCSKFNPLGIITLQDNLEPNNDVEFTGKISASNGTGVIITDGSLTVDTVNGSSKFNFELTNLAVICDFDWKSEDIGSGMVKTTNSGYFMLSTKIASYSHTFGLEGTEMFTVTIGGQDEIVNTFSTGKINVNETMTFKEKKAVSKTVNISTEGNMALKADMISFKSSEFLVPMIKFTNANAVLSNFGVNAETTYDETEGKMVMNSTTVRMGFGADAEEMITRWAFVEEQTMESFKFSIPSIVCELSGTNVGKVVIEPISMTGLADPDLITCTTYVEIGTSAITVDFDANGHTTKFDFGLRVWAHYNGLDKAFTFDLENMVISQKNAERDATTTIGKMHFCNELPLKKLLVVSDTIFMDNMEIDAVAENVTLLPYVEEGNAQALVKMKEFMLTYKNFGPTEELYIKLVDNVTINTRGTVICDGAVGYIKESDFDINEFYITKTAADPVKLKLAKGTIVPLTFKLEIISGDAVFSGGLLPMEISIGNKASLYADGLSAVSFIFAKNAKASGWVKIDTSDGLVDAKLKNYVAGRYFIWNYEEQDERSFNIRQYFYENESIVDAGCTVWIDLTNIKGKVVANDNMTIPDMSTIKSKGLKLGTVSSDMKELPFEFTEDESSLSVRCVGDVFVLNLHYTDSTVSRGYNYNSVIQLPAMEGKEQIVGWRDTLTGKIYFTEDTVATNDGASFVMPARNVDLEIVYVDEKTATIDVEKTATIDARNSTLAHVSESELEKISTNAENVVIEMSNITVKMSIDTFRNMVGESEDLYMTCSHVTSLDDKLQNKAIKDKTAYSITFYNSYEELEYAGTEYYVTVKAYGDGGASGFNAYYVDEYGHLISAKVIEFKDNGDGSYNVTFVASHFSTYALEPTYTAKEVSNVTVIVVAAIMVICALGGLLFYKKN